MFFFIKTIPHTPKSTYGSIICRQFSAKIYEKHNTTPPIINQKNEKLIKVAIVGLPNAGKSTFINNLINHRVSTIPK